MRRAASNGLVNENVPPVGQAVAEYVLLRLLSSINKYSDSSGFSMLLFFFVSGILLFKSLHAARRIYDLLFTCHKRMALRTYLNFYVLFGGHCFNYVSTYTGDCRFRIFRVNTFLHCL